MSEIKFSKEDKEVLVQKLKRYFSAEMDQDVGQFECEFFLDFISKEIGSYYYNKGLSDAQAIIAAKIDDISDALYDSEVTTHSVNR
jgi:uncharacterized protein (DUF2164 family)